MKKIFLLLLISGCLLTASFDAGTRHFAYALDEANSVVIWEGSSPKTTHQGSFAITSKGIAVVDEKVVGGSFTIPILSIDNFDLPKLTKPVLLKHLKSKDFFNSSLYPEASFTITNVDPLDTIPAGAVEGANTMIRGDFTLLGTTLPVSFPARIALKGAKLEVEATFVLDRTRWGMNHAADPALGNRHIYPEVAIHLYLSGIKN